MIRRVLVDLHMVSLLKSVIKLVPVLTLIALSILLSYRFIEDRLEAQPRTQTVQVEITPEANLFEIGKQLESKQLIHNYILFPMYSTSYSLFKQVYIPARRVPDPAGDGTGRDHAHPLQRDVSGRHPGGGYGV